MRRVREEDREAWRKLTLAEYGDPTRKLSLRDIEEADRDDLKAALSCRGLRPWHDLKPALKARLLRLHGFDVPLKLVECVNCKKWRLVPEAANTEGDWTCAWEGRSCDDPPSLEEAAALDEQRAVEEDATHEAAPSLPPSGDSVPAPAAATTAAPWWGVLGAPGLGAPPGVAPVSAAPPPPPRPREEASGSGSDDAVVSLTTAERAEEKKETMFPGWDTWTEQLAVEEGAGLEAEDLGRDVLPPPQEEAPPRPLVAAGDDTASYAIGDHVQVVQFTDKPTGKVVALRSEGYDVRLDHSGIVWPLTANALARLEAPAAAEQEIETTAELAARAGGNVGV